VTAAYLAPYLTQRFVDNNGNPLINGTVSTYAGGTTTPIATYVDSTGTTQNTNPITLNFRGECQIWLLPNVSYKFVIQDSFGNLINTIDNVVNAALITLYGGVDTGVANAYVLNFVSPVPPNTNGQVIFWLPANSNTGPSTINVNGGGVQPILNPNGTPLGANQILANQFASIIELNGVWQLYGGSGVGVNVGTFGQEFVIAAAPTTDLGSAPGHNVNITGTNITISSFGNSAQIVAPIYIGRFTGSVILANSASLVLPGGMNIVTQNGDAFLAEFMGSGVWRVLHYQPILPDFGFSKVKFVDTAITSSATLTADPALLVNVSPGQYALEIYLLFDSVTAAAGFKWQIDGTAIDSRATIPVIGTGFVNGAFASFNASPYGSPVAYATVSNTANSNQVLYKGSMLVTTSFGTVGIQWAQNSSTATATTLRAGSYITATPIGNSANSAAVTRLYTTAGSFTETIPPGVSTCVIEAFGAGGGGGAKFTSGGNTSGGGGGGSGGYARTSVAVGGAAGQTMSLTVGAGANGLNGGPSFVQSGSFTLTTLTGGGGILGGSAPNLATGGTGGAGGTASGGTVVNTSGNAGSAGASNAGGGAGGAGGPGISGINAGGNPGGIGGGILPNQPGGTGVICFSYT
jgi:hypothetical protein